MSLTLAFPMIPFSNRGRILGRKSFPPCYSETPLQLCMEISIFSTHATSSSFYSAYTVKEKGVKTDMKPHPFLYVLRNPYRNLKSENPQDYAHKPQKNLRS